MNEKYLKILRNECWAWGLPSIWVRTLYSCAHLILTRTWQVELAVILTIFDTFVQRMTNLTKMSWPKILPDTLALMIPMSKEETGLGIFPVTQGDDIH